MFDEDFSIARLERILKGCHPLVEIRHDVDYDIGCALQMARLEREIGVTSTYYIRGRAPDYHPFSDETEMILNEIVKLGHEIGMHVDLGLPRDAEVSDGELSEACYEDLELFRQAGVPVAFHVSFHAPPRSVLWRKVAGFESAHDPRWKGRYVADSRGVWKDSPEERIERAEPLQLGLHPEWHFWLPHVAQEWRVKEAAKP